MNKSFKTHLPFLMFLGIYLVFFLLGINGVPFHPDEATQIHNSRELITYLTDPRLLAWDGELPVTENLRFRMIDAPLPRYTIGFIRLITDHAPPSAHWDWGKTFQENTAAGALPSDKMLHGSRIMIAASIPLAMGFLYLTGLNLFERDLSGLNISGRLTGWLAAALLGLNPLVLLHGRRAMAEGLLILMVSVFLWVSTRQSINPWLLGAAAALAFNAKQTALVLVPLGIVGLSWNPVRHGSWKKLFGRLMIFLIVILALTWMLNPVFWEDPWRTLLVSWDLRSSLAAQQSTDYYRGPSPNPLQRCLILIMNLYITPPRIADVGNYLEVTREASRAYFANPLHNLFRGLVPGSLMLSFTALGVYQVSKALLKDRFAQPGPSVLLLGLIAQAAGLVIFIPLPWQRYAAPLLPYAVLLIAAGLEPFLKLAVHIIPPDQHAD
jgi:hypothetical protein